jgi:hypothetical protein
MDNRSGAGFSCSRCARPRAPRERGGWTMSERGATETLALETFDLPTSASDGG